MANDCCWCNGRPAMDVLGAYFLQPRTNPANLGKASNRVLRDDRYWRAKGTFIKTAKSAGQKLR
jgi:hypothetical protein